MNEMSFDIEIDRKKETAINGTCFSFGAEREKKENLKIKRKRNFSYS